MQIEVEPAPECTCDGESICEAPACVAAAEAEMKYQQAIYRGSSHYRMSREEWEDVYRHKPGKAAAYPW